MENTNSKIIKFIKSNTVLCVAALAAAVTCFIVPPDKEYIGYFDFKTLTCLFCTLAVVCALKNIRFFTFLARRIVKLTGNTRSAILATVYITFIGSMLIANDMALLTFLPLGFSVINDSGKKGLLAFTFTMQTIAANLGGMLTPFGNPQNLFLYSRFQIADADFVRVMALPFAVAVLLITVCCLCVRKEKMTLKDGADYSLPAGKTILYLLLFAYSIIIVFRLVPYWTGLVIIPVILFAVDRSALKKVDYGLLLTFVFFFIFAGNMARIEVVNRFLSGLMQKDTLFFSALSCQVISNVPSAVLLSRFTQNWKELLWGVNIGGMGTLIASLASLISFREYVNDRPGKAKRYFLIYSGFSFGFLAVLLTLMMIIR